MRTYAVNAHEIMLDLVRFPLETYLFGEDNGYFYLARSFRTETGQIGHEAYRIFMVMCAAICLPRTKYLHLFHKFSSTVFMRYT